MDQQIDYTAGMPAIEYHEASRIDGATYALALQSASDEQTDEGSGIPIAILDELPAIFLSSGIPNNQRSFPQYEF